MSNSKNFEYDCTHKCRLNVHGDIITAALTKRTIKDKDLAAYIATICCNFADVLDSLGRSAVHMSASVGRYAILEWLLNHGAVINGHDFESGSSPLHRALYYGSIDCAVLLLRYGASLEILDKDTLCPLQYICRMCDFQTEPALNDILVWGSNKNYNIGIGNEENANAPQAIDFFRKSNISIEAVALGTFHSLFLDKKHNLYAVGHGMGGRLGVPGEKSLPAPRKIKLPFKHADEEIISISVSNKHSLVLTNLSQVYACGLNSDQQLGIRDVGNHLSNFKLVVSFRGQNKVKLTRVIALSQYSVAYSTKGIYVWGANVGQLGMSAEVKHVPIPTLMRLQSNVCVEFVEANSAAMAVYTMQGVILLFYHEKHRAIKPPNYEDIKCISLVGGEGYRMGVTKGSAAALKMLLLTKTNVAFFWYENTEQFYRISFDQILLSEINYILYKANQVLVLSRGTVYRGKCIQMNVNVSGNPEPKSGNTYIDWCLNNDRHRFDISRDQMIRVDLERVPNIDRAVEIYCNDDFSSFAVLQESHLKYFNPPPLAPTEYNFKKLYHHIGIKDTVHDLVFHVDGETFKAHKLIVFSRSPGLRKLIIGRLDKHITLNFKFLTSKMFELILKYIYTNYLPNVDDIVCIRHSMGPDCPEFDIDLGRLFYDHVNCFQLTELAHYLSNFIDLQFFASPDRSMIRFNRLRRKDFPELHDVRIICGGDRELMAHKCVLIARLEYFEMMFTHSWAEHSTINLSTVPYEYMEPIIDFLYSADIERFRREHYPKSFLYNMIIYCDQFFIERLQEVCESQILEKISIRKCGDMLDFACMYNCKLLKKGCMYYICQNLARVLAYRSIEQCEPETIRMLNDHYRHMFKDVFQYRTITPNTTALEDEVMLSVIDDFTVDLDYRMDEEQQQKVATKQKELKGKHDTRQYERDAISSMMKLMSMQEVKPASTVERSQAVEDAENAAVQLQNESQNWLKVTDKKEQKRKSTEIAVKANGILMEEAEAEAEAVGNLVPISSLPASGNAVQQVEVATPSRYMSCYELDLASLTPQSHKLSQKQRKRQNSETNNDPAVTNWRAKSAEKTIKEVPNAWGIRTEAPPPTELASIFPSETLPSSPPTGSSLDPCSFANMTRTSQSATTSPISMQNSFSSILAEERRKREQADRMGHKSLVMTQIEETAIAELREFYNADNVSDENIVVERLKRPRRKSFSAWEKHN